MKNLDQALFLEANLISQRVWGLSPSEEIGERYVAVLQHYEGPSAPSLPEWLFHVADWESVEYFLRITSPRNILTRRVSAMSFLLETDPRNFGEFVNDRYMRVAAWVSLLTQGARSLALFIKGGWLTLFRWV